MQPSQPCLFTQYLNEQITFVLQVFTIKWQRILLLEFHF